MTAAQLQALTELMGKYKVVSWYNDYPDNIAVRMEPIDKPCIIEIDISSDGSVSCWKETLRGGCLHQAAKDDWHQYIEAA